VALHNGTLQNGNVTKRYVLQNGTHYKTVRFTKQYALQNGTRYKTVRVTKRYALQNGNVTKR
jgi:DNA-directed RNA polymerase subunit K/omega